MKRFPSIWTLYDLSRHIKEGPTKEIDGVWYPARTLGLMSFTSRVLLAWEVLTGRADVLRWPGDQ